MNVDFQAAEIARERDKYRRMWRLTDYRRWSPGEHCATRAIARLAMKPGDSVTDFGCGTGRACAVFQRHGLTVHAIDHAENCLDPEIRVPLEIACLWELSPAPATTYGFCADVMEHIPPGRIDAVLAAIAARVRRAAFFRISTVPDGCGKLIGERLHLTVEPAAWWVERVGRVFEVAHWRAEAGDVEIVAHAPCLYARVTG
jgi:hypothetical protein